MSSKNEAGSGLMQHAENKKKKKKRIETSMMCSIVGMFN